MIKKFLDRYPSATLPIFLLFLNMILLLIWLYLGDESLLAMVEFLKNLVRQYGLIALFIGTLIETLFMISIYLPGSVVIVVSVVLYENDYLSLFYVFMTIVLAALIANVANYYIGKKGLIKIFKYLGAEKAIKSAESQVQKYGKYAMFFSSINPNLLGIMSTYYGLSNVTLKKTLVHSFISTIFWVPILMLVTLLLKDVLMSTSRGSLLVWPIFLILWILLAIVMTELQNSDKYKCYISKLVGKFKK
jgi:membrane protein DedA with SNARE-associated domain